MLVRWEERRGASTGETIGRRSFRRRRPQLESCESGRGRLGRRRRRFVPRVLALRSPLRRQPAPAVRTATQKWNIRSELFTYQTYS